MPRFSAMHALILDPCTVVMLAVVSRFLPPPRLPAAAPPIAAPAPSATPPTMPATTGGAGQGWIREMKASMEQRNAAVNPVMMMMAMVVGGVVVE